MGEREGGMREGQREGGGRGAGRYCGAFCSCSYRLEEFVSVWYANTT